MSRFRSLLALMPKTVPVVLPSYSFQAISQAFGLGSTYTYSSVAIGTAATGRLVVTAVFSLQAVAPRTISSVTIGGITAGLVPNTTFTVSSASGDYDIAFYAAEVPTGTNANIVVTMSGSVNSIGNGAIAVWATYDLASITAVDADGVVGTAGNATVNVPAISTSSGGFILAAAVQYSTTTTPTFTWTNITKITDAVRTGPPSIGYGTASADTTGASVSITAVGNNTVDYVLAIAASFR